MKHIKYHKIRSFKDVIKEVKSKAEFIGLDENQNPIFDQDLKKPPLTFKGTVKLHGTNAGIQYNFATQELRVQSRSQFKDDGHFGFSNFVHANRQKIVDFINTLSIPEGTESIVLFGEWVGQGIQKGVGVTGMSPSFFLFDILMNNGTEERNWIDITGLNADIDNWYNIFDFETFTIDIDFEKPKEAADKMAEMVDYVEKQCPVAKAFNLTGIGEGIVFKSEYKGQRLIFKAKGEAHKVVSTKEKIPISEEDLKSIEEFVAYCVTDARIDQGIQEACNGELDKKHTGSFIKWIIKDIESEEIVAINNLKVQGYRTYIANAARKKFFEKVDAV